MATTEDTTGTTGDRDQRPTADLRELFEQLTPYQQEHVTGIVRNLVQCYENEQLDRYVAALRRTPRNEWGLQTIPDELAGEFYEDSIDDTLNAQAAILDFIKHSITLTTSDCELGSRATTGLYYILRSAIDNVENCALMLHAYRVVGREE